MEQMQEEDKKQEVLPSSSDQRLSKKTRRRRRRRKRKTKEEEAETGQRNEATSLHQAFPQGGDGEDERCLALLEQVKIKNKKILESMSQEQLLDLTLKYFDKDPGAFYDAQYMSQHRHDPLPSAGLPAVTWCTCGNCKDLPTDQERICCGQEPCTSRLPRFTLYCLDAGLLRLHRRLRLYRDGLLGTKQTRELGEDNREFRDAAYRNYILWQSGPLDNRRNHVAVPSCCVWAVRDHFPDPWGQYPAYVPDH